MKAFRTNKDMITDPPGRYTHPAMPTPNGEVPSSEFQVPSGNEPVQRASPEPGAQNSELGTRNWPSARNSALPPRPSPPFHIVLLNPEIPNNTGNIGRTAAATGCRLHVIHPIGFDMSEKAVRRAGLDYWHLVDYREHESWEAFLLVENPPPGRLWLYTTKAARPHWDAKFRAGDYLLFGRETRGVDESIQEWTVAHHGDDHRITLPMIDNPAARSLNLATAVCAAVYEGLRQMAIGP
jgi:tRNA (cytidine/uridine-2'-O-)-methyltransferase